MTSLILSVPLLLGAVRRGGSDSMYWVARTDSAGLGTLLTNMVEEKVTQDRIESLQDEFGDDHAAADLVRRGIADPPSASYTDDKLRAMRSPRLPDGVSAGHLITTERADGR